MNPERSTEASRPVVILGAGIAGMESALVLAEMGRPVYLLDEEPAIGGFFHLLDRTFPTNSCGICFMSPSYPALCPVHECRLNERIRLMPSSTITGFEKDKGGFSVTVRQTPRHIDPGKCDLCGLCLDVCPVEVKREFGGGLEKRKAVYHPFPQTIPPSPVIDFRTCTRCGECLKVCKRGAIDLEATDRNEVLQAGAVILGFGCQPYPAVLKGEYGFGRYENVMTAIQFERMLATSGPSGGYPQRLSDGGKIGRLAFIQCVGSRDVHHGREHCSTICCMYAAKQAMIAKRRCPDLDISIYYIDLRAMGKNYERYIEKAQNEYGIKYKRCSVSNIKELQSSKNLLIRFIGEDGITREEEFGAAVLSVGFTSPPFAVELAGLLGVQLNRHGFCHTNPFHPSGTSAPGIFVAGSFRGPRDIPETVVEGACAAAEAASFLSSEPPASPHHQAFQKMLPEDEIPKIGLFICRCKDELDHILSFDKLTIAASEMGDVDHVEVLPLACLPEGFALIREKKDELSLNRLVVAGCSSRAISGLVETLSRETGFHPSLIEFANIREQCALVHKEQPKQASEKAVALIRMAVERARRIESVPIKDYPFEPKGLVIGGGVAGMTAALKLAELGFEVHLVEKEERLGGNLRRIYYTLDGADPQAYLKDLIARAEGHPLVNIYTGAEVRRCTSDSGHYLTTISQPQGDLVLDHGTLIMATGGKEMTPWDYLFGVDDRVITQRSLEELLHDSDGDLVSIESVVMIQCVGSRSEEHNYCSRICCRQAVKNALKLKEIKPGLKIYVLYRDMRVFGIYESHYLEARKKGVIFIRYTPEDNPEVFPENGALAVKLTDPALGEKIILKADRVILSAGIEPPDHAGIAGVYGLELDQDGFFKEVNPKSAPIDALGRGRFFCGLCQSPNGVEEVIAQGKAAAARAAVVMTKGLSEDRIYKAFTIERLCGGCGLCVTSCPFQARSLNEDRKSVVDAFLCRGCGSCAATCHNGAARQKNYLKDTTLAVIDAGLD